MSRHALRTVVTGSFTLALLTGAASAGEGDGNPIVVVIAIAAVVVGIGIVVVRGRKSRGQVATALSEPSTAAARADPKRSCSNCGHGLDADAHFCPSCGHRVEA